MPNNPNDRYTSWGNGSAGGINIIEFNGQSSPYVFIDEVDPLSDLIEDANDGIKALKKLTKEHKGKFKIVNGVVMKKENT